MTSNEDASQLKKRFNSNYMNDSSLISSESVHRDRKNSGLTCQRTLSRSIPRTLISLSKTTIGLLTSPTSVEKHSLTKVKVHATPIHSPSPWWSARNSWSNDWLRLAKERGHSSSIWWNVSKLDHGILPISWAWGLNLIIQHKMTHSSHISSSRVSLKNTS